jgi:hypothetical protein
MKKYSIFSGIKQKPLLLSVLDFGILIVEPVAKSNCFLMAYSVSCKQLLTGSAG